MLLFKDHFTIFQLAFLQKIALQQVFNFWRLVDTEIMAPLHALARSFDAFDTNEQGSGNIPRLTERF